jgi:hypothetical protein
MACFASQPPESLLVLRKVGSLLWVFDMFKDMILPASWQSTGL